MIKALHNITVIYTSLYSGIIYLFTTPLHRIIKTKHGQFPLSIQRTEEMNNTKASKQAKWHAASPVNTKRSRHAGLNTKRDSDSHLVPNSRNTFKQLLRSDTRLSPLWLYNHRPHAGRAQYAATIFVVDHFVCRML